MQSFRTEIENPIVEKDIIELEAKIRQFKEGNIDEEKFRSLRLARRVFGQRQFGVQMIRIKLPYGKVSSHQLNRICDVSDEYSTGRLHITLPKAMSKLPFPQMANLQQQLKGYVNFLKK